jgi:hypothetical protein
VGSSPTALTSKINNLDGLSKDQATSNRSQGYSLGYSVQTPKEVLG